MIRKKRALIHCTDNDKRLTREFSVRSVGKTGVGARSSHICFSLDGGYSSPTRQSRTDFVMRFAKK